MNVELRVIKYRPNYESIMILPHHQRLQPEVSVFLLWRRKWWKCYKSIGIEVSISISILLRQSIDIGIDDTFKAGIDIEYWRYFWKISITTLLLAAQKLAYGVLVVLLACAVAVWSAVNVAGTRLQDLVPNIGKIDDPENWEQVHCDVIERCAL